MHSDESTFSLCFRCLLWVKFINLVYIVLGWGGFIEPLRVPYKDFIIILIRLREEKRQRRKRNNKKI